MVGNTVFNQVKHELITLAEDQAHDIVDLAIYQHKDEGGYIDYMNFKYSRSFDDFYERVCNTIKRELYDVMEEKFECLKTKLGKEKCLFHDFELQKDDITECDIDFPISLNEYLNVVMFRALEETAKEHRFFSQHDGDDESDEDDDENDDGEIITEEMKQAEREYKVFKQFKSALINYAETSAECIIDEAVVMNKEHDGYDDYINHGCTSNDFYERVYVAIEQLLSVEIEIVVGDEQSLGDFKLQEDDITESDIDFPNSLNEYFNIVMFRALKAVTKTHRIWN